MEKQVHKGKWKNRLLSLLYPPKCICCGALLEGEENICIACQAVLPTTDQNSCVQRGKWFSLCVSPFFLEGVVNDSLNQFKFHHQEGNGIYFGRRLGVCARGNIPGVFDVITWIPVSRKRRWERGFDQSQVLAQKVAEQYDQPFIRTLEKRQNVAPLSQSKGGRTVREQLVKGLYQVCTSRCLKGQRILLVDDIITTGSTLNEASRVLLQAGAVEVCCAAVARSRLFI